MSACYVLPPLPGGASGSGRVIDTDLLEALVAIENETIHVAFREAPHPPAQRLLATLGVTWSVDPNAEPLADPVFDPWNRKPSTEEQRRKWREKKAQELARGGRVIIAGIDFSTKAIDLVFLSETDNTAAWSHRVIAASGPPDSFLATRRIRDVMPIRAAYGDMGVIAIAIEKPYSMSYKASSALMRVQGAVIACLPPEIAVAEFSPQEWKRDTVGFSNASKDDVRAFAMKHWVEENVALLPQDVCDAYCIAWACRKRVTREIGFGP